MRRGFTTGACAQAATRAAALSLRSVKVPREGLRGDREAGRDGFTGSVRIKLPDGEEASFPVDLIEPGICSVVKDAGDDPDITHGLKIFASMAARRDGRIVVNGGEGVGKVTLPGLAVAPGRPAINPAPLRQLRAEAAALMPGGAGVIISIPGGEKLAGRTFNPRLGIEGGLSILGTTGRVEPWSAKAYQESLIPQLDVAAASGLKEPVLVPGAKGEKAAFKSGYTPAEIIQTGNYAGIMLKAARARGFRQVIMVGHVSKLAKLARGDFDTHSRRSGPPLDVLAAMAEKRGLSSGQALVLKRLPTTEAAVKQLIAAGMTGVLDEVAEKVAAAVSQHFDLKAKIMLTDGAGAIVGQSRD